MIITSPGALAVRFGQLLGDAKEVCIASAWASPGDHLEQVKQWAKAGGGLKSVIGLSGASTVPAALRDLAGAGELRTPEAETRSVTGYRNLFHPKFYLFKGTRSVALVGSANFTGGGFGSNFEVCAEIADDGDLNDLFERLWRSATVMSEPQIEAYEAEWAKRPRAPFRPFVKQPLAADKHPADYANLGAADWADYVALLKGAETYWWDHEANHKVWGDAPSYQACIDTVGPILLDRDWDSLTNVEREMILAHRGDKTRLSFDFGLLGSMYAAGEFKALFFNPKAGKDREAAQSALKRLARNPAADLDAVIATLESLMARNGTGIGAATRLMALVRPDLCVSVNNASTARLQEQSGIDRNRFRRKAAAPKAYRELLAWVWTRPWFQSPEPADLIEQQAWRLRAALVDAVVYDPNRKDG